MVEERKPLNFGPSERYLPALKEGDALTFQLNDIGVDVDTEFGQKLQFSLRVINTAVSPSSSIKEGTYVWNTTCKAAKALHEYLTDADDQLGVPATHFLLQAEEYGYRIKEVE